MRTQEEKETRVECQQRVEKMLAPSGIAKARSRRNTVPQRTSRSLGIKEKHVLVCNALHLCPSVRIENEVRVEACQMHSGLLRGHRADTQTFCKH